MVVGWCALIRILYLTEAEAPASGDVVEKKEESKPPEREERKRPREEDDHGRRRDNRDRGGEKIDPPSGGSAALSIFFVPYIYVSVYLRVGMYVCTVCFNICVYLRVGMYVCTVCFNICVDRRDRPDPTKAPDPEAPSDEFSEESTTSLLQGKGQFEPPEDNDIITLDSCELPLHDLHS